MKTSDGDHLQPNGKLLEHQVHGAQQENIGMVQQSDNHQHNYELVEQGNAKPDAYVPPAYVPPQPRDNNMQLVDIANDQQNQEKEEEEEEEEEEDDEEDMARFDANENTVWIDSDGDEETENIILKQNLFLPYNDHDYDPPNPSDRVIHPQEGVFPIIGGLDEVGNIIRQYMPPGYEGLGEEFGVPDEYELADRAAAAENSRLMNIQYQQQLHELVEQRNAKPSAYVPPVSVLPQPRAITMQQFDLTNINKNQEEKEAEDIISKRNFFLPYSDHDYDPPNPADRVIHPQEGIFPIIGGLDEEGNIIRQYMPPGYEGQGEEFGVPDEYELADRAVAAEKTRLMQIQYQQQLNAGLQQYLAQYYHANHFNAALPYTENYMEYLPAQIVFAQGGINFTPEQLYRTQQQYGTPMMDAQSRVVQPNIHTVPTAMILPKTRRPQGLEHVMYQPSRRATQPQAHSFARMTTRPGQHILNSTPAVGCLGCSDSQQPQPQLQGQRGYPVDPPIAEQQHSVWRTMSPSMQDREIVEHPLPLLHPPRRNQDVGARTTEMREPVKPVQQLHNQQPPISREAAPMPQQQPQQQHLQQEADIHVADLNEYSQAAAQLIASMDQTAGAGILLQGTRCHKKARQMFLKENVAALVATENVSVRQIVFEMNGHVSMWNEVNRQPGGGNSVFLYDGLMKGIYGEVVGTGQEFVCIDAKKKGNDSRFTRRSCAPNCVLKHVLGSQATLGIMLVTTKDIPKNVEVTLPFDADWRDADTPLECAKHLDELHSCPMEAERRWYASQRLQTNQTF